MPHIIFGHSPPVAEQPKPLTRREGFERRMEFLRMSARAGVQRSQRLLTALTILVPVSVAAALKYLFDVDFLLAFVVLLTALFLVTMEGAFRHWDEANRLAWALFAGWRDCFGQAEGLRGVMENGMFDAEGNAIPPENETPQQRHAYKQSWSSTHRPSVLDTCDRAEAAGYPVRIKRDEILNIERADLPKLIEAFEDAGRRWKDDQELKGQP